MVTHDCKQSIIRLAVLLIAVFVLVGCGGEEPIASGVVPEVFVFPSGSELRLISEEQIPQNNCDGSAETSQTLERQHTILYTLELGGGVTVGADGRAKIPEIGEVGVGVEVASNYQVGYGREEAISRSVTVAAKEGTHIQHTVRQYEVWETGEVLVSATGINKRFPYSFRRDFSIETVPPASIGCPSSSNVTSDESEVDQVTPPTITPTASSGSGSTSQQTVASLTRKQVDDLFGAQNWFCFPDRANGIGVVLLPVNFTVGAPIRYVDTYRGRFNVGDTAPGATGATVDLVETLAVENCPVWQQAALSSWRTERINGQSISSAGQIDNLVGAGNWSCLPDYSFGARVFYLSSDLEVKYPLTTVDIYDGSKHGVGETIAPGGEITIWFAGSIPGSQCP